MNKRLFCCFIANMLALSLVGCSLFKPQESDTESAADSVATNSQLNDDVGEIKFTPTKLEHIAKTDDAIMYADNEVLIVVKDGTDYDAVQKLAAQYNAEIVGMIELTGDYQLRILEAHTLNEINQIIEKLRFEEIVVSADLDYIHIYNESQYSYGNDKNWSAGLLDASDCWGDSWGFETIETPAAWGLLQENIDKVNPVKLGLIDAGFDTQHEDLKDCFVETIYNTSSNEHGTHVAGTMAANADNSEGICGVYPYGKNNLYGVSLGGVSEYSENGEILYNSMLLKIAYAELIIRNVKVINSSLGFNYYKPENWNNHVIPSSGNEWDERAKFVDDNVHILADFLKRMYDKGYDFVLVNAAGNDSDRQSDTIYDARYNWWTCAISHEDYPELYDRIIVVGAIDGTFHTSNFSNGGKRVDVYAPGEHIYSTAHGGYEDEFIENGNKTVWSGTSMASPHVAGVAAMVWAANNTLTGADVKKIICETANADRIFDDSSLRIIGQLHYDLVNARRAVAKALGIETDENSSEQNNGSILCWVVEKGSDDKISNATVVARSSDTNEIIEQTTTDSNGHFELILPEGKYVLTVTESSGRYEEYTSQVIEVKNQSVNYLDDWIKLIRKTTELSQYLGTGIDDFLAKHPDLQKVDTSDGTLEYKNTEIIVSAKPTNKLIDFISICGNSDYSLNGLWYGMLFSEADQHLTQSVSSVPENKADYRYLHLGNSTDISYHADASGRIDSVSVFVISSIPEPDESEDQNTEPPAEGHTYYDYYGGILENGTTNIIDAGIGSSYSANLSWYDLVDIDQDHEKELVAEYDVPGGGEVGRYLVIYKVEGSIISESEPISVYHANSFYLAADGNGIIYAGYTPGCYWFGRILPHTYQCESIDSCSENDGDYAAYERTLDSYAGEMLLFRPVSDLSPLNETAPDYFEEW